MGAAHLLKQLVVTESRDKSNVKHHVSRVTSLEQNVTGKSSCRAQQLRMQRDNPHKERRYIRESSRKKKKKKKKSSITREKQQKSKL